MNLRGLSPIPALALALWVVAAGCADREDPTSPADASTSAPDAGGALPSDAGRPDAGPACDPPCGPAQYCDESVTPGLCVEVCAPSAGCPPTEVCNLQTQECEPVECAGARCEAGQLCADPSLGSSGGPGDVCTCLPAGAALLTAGEDTCAGYGLVCGAAPATSGPWTCRRPLLDEPCLPAYGCSAGFECRTIFEGLHRCVRPCLRSSDCPDLDTFCVPQTSAYEWWVRATCRASYCADPSHPRPGSTPDGERALYSTTCALEDGSVGTCLPQLAPTAEGLREVGLCRRAGGLAVGTACLAEARHSEGLCAAGSLCSGGECLPLCDLRDEAGASCVLVAPDLVCGALEPVSDPNGAVGLCRRP